eukprot:m.483856 g.483856  ORF g.483856 m.483856 type:complete len:123 (-) comp21729_c0_seq5:156-524(-)
MLGGLSAHAAGCALQPWNTFASPSGFVNEFLLLYSMITGGLLGVMVVDYMYIRRQTLSLSHLYSGCSVTGGLANRRRQNHQGGQRWLSLDVDHRYPTITLVSHHYPFLFGPCTHAYLHQRIA